MVLELFLRYDLRLSRFQQPLLGDKNAAYCNIRGTKGLH